MRFKMEKRRLGETRTVNGFLFFPKWIDGEMRWLEKAYWVEECVFGGFGPVPAPSGYSPIPDTLTLNYRWNPTKWHLNTP